jgi:hypothetical protein
MQSISALRYGMPARTFGGLSPFDFEALMRDITWEHLAVRVESFTQGRDGGIDLRARTLRRSDQIMPPGVLVEKQQTRGHEVIIVQCKHYESSGFSKLKSKVIEEKAKVDLLKPGRYIIATTVGLTPSRKTELYAELQPWCKSEDDIWGADDIEGFLARYPEIEKNNFKLWLNSVGVLERVLHNDVIARTAGYRDDLLRSARIQGVATRPCTQSHRAGRRRDRCRVLSTSGYPVRCRGSGGPEALRLLDAIKSPDREFDAVVIGEPQRAFLWQRLPHVATTTRPTGSARRPTGLSKKIADCDAQVERYRATSTQGETSPSSPAGSRRCPPYGRRLPPPCASPKRHRNGSTKIRSARSASAWEACSRSFARLIRATRRSCTAASGLGDL